MIKNRAGKKKFPKFIGNLPSIIAKWLLICQLFVRKLVKAVDSRPPYGELGRRASAGTLIPVAVLLK